MLQATVLKIDDVTKGLEVRNLNINTLIAKA
jgi:hypothetical protein